MFNSTAAYEISEMYYILWQVSPTFICLPIQSSPAGDPLLLSYTTGLISWHIPHNVGSQDIISLSYARKRVTKLIFFCLYFLWQSTQLSHVLTEFSLNWKYVPVIPTVANINIQRSFQLKLCSIFQQVQIYICNIQSTQHKK
jgi:hypothetical protein